MKPINKEAEKEIEKINENIARIEAERKQLDKEDKLQTLFTGLYFLGGLGLLAGGIYLLAGCPITMIFMGGLILLTLLWGRL